MHFPLIVSLLSALAAATPNYHRRTSNATYCPPVAVKPWQQEAIFNDFVDQLYVQKDVAGAFA